MGLTSSIYVFFNTGGTVLDLQQLLGDVHTDVIIGMQPPQVTLHEHVLHLTCMRI